MDYDENLSDEELGYGGDHEHDDQDDELTRKECIDRFSSPDYIMEPGVFNTLQRYFKAEGSPEQVVTLLSTNYKAMAQTANLLAEWLILAGVDIHTLQDLVENHLKDMILKHFDTKKADAIFADGEVKLQNCIKTPQWLQEMIEFPTWRMLFYRLAEEYPDCLMLNFTIKLISDAGYQGEITSVSTACHQLEVFSRVLKTSITSYLQDAESFLKNSMQDFSKMVCHGEHTYLYTQILLQKLSQENKGGPKIKRLSQELQKHAVLKGINVTSITYSLIGGSEHSRACQAVASMMSKNNVNPADVMVLHTAFTSPQPPPVEMIRNPSLINLFTEYLFKPSVKINPDYRSKYLYLLAYGCTVAETYKKGSRKDINKDDLKPTLTALDKAQKICSDNKAGNELLADLSTLFSCLKYPVVAKGVLLWISHTVTEPKYFVHNTDHTPIHLVLLDEVSSCQPLLQESIQTLLIKLFETSYEEVDVLVQLDLKKKILNRMVHLLSKGYVIPVCQYIKSCFEKQSVDISLIRHFVTEVIEMISPPYTQQFVDVFYPLIANEDLTSGLKSDSGYYTVSDFISHCQKNFKLDNL